MASSGGQSAWPNGGTHEMLCQVGQSVIAEGVRTCYLLLLLLCGGSLLVCVACCSIPACFSYCACSPHLLCFIANVQAYAADHVNLILLQVHSLSATMFSLAGGFWSNVGLLALTVFPGAGCCFVAFCSRVALAKHACMLPGLWGVCCDQGVPTCSLLYCWVLCCLAACQLHQCRVASCLCF